MPFLLESIITALAKENIFGTKEMYVASKCIGFYIDFPESSWGEQGAFLENILFPLCCVG